MYASFTVLIALFMISRLDQLNRINDSIIQGEIPLVELTDKMMDTLLAQQTYGHRSIIIKGPDLMPPFWARSDEFDQLLKQMEALPYRKALPIVRLTALHTEYNNLFTEGFDYLKNPSSSMASKYDQAIKNKQEEITQLFKKISYEAHQNQNDKSRLASSIGNSVFQVAVGFCILSIFLGILAAMRTARKSYGLTHQLKFSPMEIGEGKFEHSSQVANQGEIKDLSQAFQWMVKSLRRLEETYLDASPLTHLPGGIAIENTTKKRLSDGLPLAFCLIDLADFKSFNDRYGYARGNEVIQATARIITEVMAEQGREKDFLGHIGGDDFVIITVPGAYEKICPAIINVFDRMILDFYDAEDRERGYILGKTRQGKEISFPIMTVSIAVVTNRQRELKSHIQVGEIAAELKNYAKSFSKSAYVVDRRKDDRPGKE